jgi:ubiquinone/menaquinone biosynthesis C-methylase UbiE
VTDAQARKTLISRTYDASADGYARIGYFPLYARRLVEIAEIKPGATILDVACGRGAVLLKATERIGPGAHILGVDLSPEMALATGADITSRGIGNAATATMDAESLALADSSIDHILCAFSMQFFPNLSRALAEFCRVLRPGGRVAVSTWGADDPAWDWYDDLVASYGARASLRTQSLDSPEVVTGWLADAGFTAVTSIVEETDFVYANADECWNMRWNLSGRAELEQMDEARLARFTAEANERLESMRQPDGFHELQEVIYTVAARPAIDG